MAASQIESLPMLAFPPANVRESIGTQDWQTCIQAWESVCQSFLRLPPELFESVLKRPEPSSLAGFLGSYVEEVSALEHRESYLQEPKAGELHRVVHLLVHRALSQIKEPPDLLCRWTFLGCCCDVYRHSGSLATLTEKFWTTYSEQLNASLQKYKTTLTRRLGTGKANTPDIDQFTHCLLPLIRSCPSAGMYMLAGSDLIDAIVESYSAAALPWRSKLLLLVYVMFLSPLQAERSNGPLLYDHLYGLREIAEKGQKNTSGSYIILTDLVTDTPFLSKASKLLSGKPDASRGESFLKSLEKFRGSQSSRLRPVRKRKLNKGKGRAADKYGHGEAFSGVHVHWMSLVSQVQDLFPDLGDGFIVKLLDEYGDNVEMVTAHLLENTLPSHLQALDRSEQLPDAHHQPISKSNPVPGLAPRSTPPPSPPRVSQRRNIYDDDEFDRLAVATSQLHFGRKDTDKTAFAQDSSSRNTSKAAIMSALAAFDADDDERDDTYDIADVGGTVDTAAGPEGEGDARANDMREKNERVLFVAWKTDPKIFGRDSATRRGKVRDALRSETGMTDEAIEGWAIMLQRDPRKATRLEARYAQFGGQQAQLGRTSYRKSWGDGETGSDTEGISSGGEASRGGRGGYGAFRGGGSGGGGMGRGRGHNVAGPTSERGTQVGRQRKETNKSSTANHNRRAQRAKKMARGGGLAG